jgi:hypothetical protein
MATIDSEIIRVADEIWIATALLHREHPESPDFRVQQIVERAIQENISGSPRPGLMPHAYMHCVGNKPPKPSGYRMLYATDKSRRRLYRPGDPSHPERRSKITPRRDEIPEKYHELLDWYESEYAMRAAEGGSRAATATAEARVAADPILGLFGSGREIWEGIDPDEYVRLMREEWR